MPPLGRPVRGADHPVQPEGHRPGRPHRLGGQFHRDGPGLRGDDAVCRVDLPGGDIPMKTAVVICPGRGVYNKAELGYLTRHHAGRREMFAAFDRQRGEMGQETLAALDGAPSFSMATHTRGDNASALIYAGSLADFLAIDRNKIDIVAVTGNSMGWYSALACGGALDR